MRLMKDQLKVRKFIDHNEPCPGELILEYYLKCKRDCEVVPDKIAKYIENCLTTILQVRNQGNTPIYNDIFGFAPFKRGGNSKREVTRQNEMFRLGSEVEDFLENGKYEDAVNEVSKEHGVSVETVKQAYTDYRKQFRISTPIPP
jgi:hypothetical protein